MVTMIIAAMLFFGSLESQIQITNRDLIPLQTVDPMAPMSDLSILDPVIGAADIVGLGEATHGSREFFLMKHRVFRYLVENKGFTIFGLEASMPDCLAMERYVATGEGDPKAAVMAQGFWTWSTEEVLDLIKWMRTYNADAKHTNKLHVVGFDMQNQVGGTLFFEKAQKRLKGDADSLFWETIGYDRLSDNNRLRANEVMNELIKDIRAKDGEEAGRTAEFVRRVYFQSEGTTIFQGLLEWQQRVIPTMSRTFADSAKLIAELKLEPGSALDGLRFLDDHKDKLVDVPKEKRKDAADSMDRQAEALQLLARSKPTHKERLLAQADMLGFLSYAMRMPDELSQPGINAFTYRDKCMAENLVEINKTLYPGQKIFAWAHNGHIMRGDASTGIRTMGTNLHGLIGKKYVPIGFAFESGGLNAMGNGTGLTEHKLDAAEPGTLDSTLGKLGKPLGFVVTKFVQGKVKSRSVGAVYDKKYESNYYAEFDLAKAFDGLIFVKNVKASRLLQ